MRHNITTIVECAASQASRLVPCAARPLLQWVVFLLAWVALALPDHPRDDGGAPPRAAARGSRRNEPRRLGLAALLQAPAASSSFGQGEHDPVERGAPGDCVFERALPLHVDAFGAELTAAAPPARSVTAVEVTRRSGRTGAAFPDPLGLGDARRDVSFSWGRHD